MSRHNTPTLKMTNPLPTSPSHIFLALSFISQYGQGLVQKSAITSDMLKPIEGETDNTNVPSSKYLFQRVTSFSRWSIEAGFESGGKKEGERSDGMAAEKSQGVTSETNQGISFGL
jgi:hypothetical protein